jgi:3-deoxy-D-manno-octulosonic-acid transferase
MNGTRTASGIGTRGGLLLVLYQALATAALLVALPFLLWRALRHRDEMAERLGWPTGPAPAAEPGSRPGTSPGKAPGVVSDTSTGASPGPFPEAAGPLWLHAASLGELESVRALWETPGRAPAGPLLVTVLSVSARRRAAEIVPAGTRVRFAPLDLWCAVLPFLRRERPRALILVETELWPLTLALCQARRVPVVLVSGRLSPRKWGRTRLLRPLLRPLLRRLAGCGAQSLADAERFRQLGARDVEVTGNLKYRLGGEAVAVSAGDQGLVPGSDGRFVFVAGSIRSGEEGVLEVARLPGVLCVLAPRHLRERDYWIAACEARRVPWILRTALELEVPPAADLPDRGTRDALRARLAAALEGSPGVGLRAGKERAHPVLLVDSHGELGAWYAASDAVFVGGTFVPIGGHNLFEPARCGVPVAFGPHTLGVEDAAAPLLRLGGGARVRDGAELAAWVAHLRAEPAAAARAAEGSMAAARALAGGVDRTFTFLSRFDWLGAPLPGGDAGCQESAG